MTTSPALHDTRHIYVEPYEVDRHLAELHLTHALLIKAAWEGDVDRRSVPAFAYDGHPVQRRIANP